MAGQADALPPMVHRDCGAEMHLVIRCAACEQLTTLRDVDIEGLEPGAFARSLPPGLRRRRSAQRTSDPLGLGNYAATMRLIGSRWSTAHLGALVMGARRFSEVQRLTGATPKVVSERLADFVDLGAITPQKSEYLIADMGEAFFVVIAPFVAWAINHRPDATGPPLVAHHRNCGSFFEPRVSCSACEGAIDRPSSIHSPQLIIN